MGQTYTDDMKQKVLVLQRLKWFLKIRFKIQLLQQEHRSAVPA